MTPTIRVEQDVFIGLQSLAEPFTDTPNTVIRRLLEERGALPKSQKKQPSSEPSNSKRTTRVPGITPQARAVALAARPTLRPLELQCPLCFVSSGHIVRTEPRTVLQRRIS